MKNSPQLGPIKVPPSTNTRASPVRRTMMNWQRAARSGPGSVVPPLQPINTMMHNGHKNVYASYPPPYPPSSAHASSPSISRSSGSTMQGGLSSPTSNFSAQQMHQQPQQHARQHRKSFAPQCPAPRISSGASVPPTCPIPGPISGKPPTIRKIRWTISLNLHVFSDEECSCLPGSPVLLPFRAFCIR